MTSFFAWGNTYDWVDRACGNLVVLSSLTCYACDIDRTVVMVVNHSGYIAERSGE